MKHILILSVLVMLLLLWLGWSPWIGIGLSLYWFSGVYSLQTMFRWDDEDGTHTKELSYSDEWVFRAFVIFAGGLFLFIIGYMAIDLMFKKQAKEKKKFKSWFEK